MFRNRRIVIGRKQLLYAFVLMVAWVSLFSSEFDPVVAIGLLAIIYLVVRVTTKPLSRFIGRLDYSIRWKFEIGIAGHRCFVSDCESHTNQIDALHAR